jgi:biopolymer transport protein ExbD
MALKKNYPVLATFSMSSMTDVIFLLLIFFMVTSTLIFPAAIEVNLPQTSEQTTLKPVTEVYLDSLSNLYVVMDRNDSIEANRTPKMLTSDELMGVLTMIQSQDSLRAIALYADTKVEYGKVVEVLDLASRNNLKMVLAARASATAPTGPVNTPISSTSTTTTLANNPQ